MEVRIYENRLGWFNSFFNSFINCSKSTWLSINKKGETR
jgi:hypothetical protein